MTQKARNYLRTGMSVGLVGGASLGCLEGLQTVHANLYLHPTRYAFFCFGAPLILTTAGAVVVTAVAALAYGRLRGECDEPDQAAVYGGILTTIALGLAAVFWAADFMARLGAIGASPAWLIVSATAVAFLLVGVGTGLSALTFRWLFDSRYRRAAVGASLVLNFAFVPVVLAYFVIDERHPLLAHGAAPRAPEEQSVLLITFDTVRADRVGAYRSTTSGESLTPALDQIADRGVVFEQAISSSSWTLPALASVLTGEHPRAHGAGRSLNSKDPLARSALRPGGTLAGVMREHGYATQAFVTNPFVAPRYGMDQGFTGFQQLTLETETLRAMEKVTVVRLARTLAPWLRVSDRAEDVTNRAVRWLRRHADRKFLLWVHYLDPHAPYVDPAMGLGTSFRGDSLLNTQRAWSVAGDIDVARIRSGEIHLSREERRALVELYDVEIRYMDGHIGRLLAELDELNVADDVVVVALSDHGEEFWEHGGVEHGRTLYDEVVHVPFILRSSTLPEGARVGDIVRSVDVAPTVLDLLGLPPLPEAQGRSLIPRIRGGPLAAQPAVSEGLVFAEPQVAVRTDRLKYVRWADGREELYDLVEDPDERRNIAECGKLELARALFEREVPDQKPAISMPNEDGSAHAWIRTALQSLGYAQ